MRRLVDRLREMDIRVCGVYCIDATFITGEASKFISGSFAALAAMVHLEVTHVNVPTKCDLLSVAEMKRVEELLEGDSSDLCLKIDRVMHPRYRQLNEAITSVISDYSMVSYAVLDPTKEDTIDELLLNINQAIQY